MIYDFNHPSCRLVGLLISDPDKEVYNTLKEHFRKYSHFDIVYVTNDPRMIKVLTLCQEYDSIKTVDFKVRIQGVERFALL
jgi:hypothetical protein